MQSQRPQIGQWLDRFGETYSKCVLAATLVALVGLPLLGVPMHSTPTQVCPYLALVLCEHERRLVGFLPPCPLSCMPMGGPRRLCRVSSKQALAW